MNRKLQNENEMQDDELYALLDSAMADDRLCVSEDLIQRTLQKVKEEKKPVTVTKRKPGYRALVQYAGLAAAALLIVFVGSNAIKNVNKESASDMAAPRAEASNSGGENKYYYSMVDSAEEMNASTAGDTMSDDKSDALRDGIAYTQNENETSAPAERDTPKDAEDATEAYFGSEELLLSDEFYEFLKKGGYEPEDKTAECWEYVGEAENAEELMEKALLTVAVTDGRNTIGSYRYPVLDSRGEEQVIVSELPLNRIIRIRTDRGNLWFLLGAETMFFLE